MASVQFQWHLHFTTQHITRDNYFKVDLQQAYSPSALESQDTKDNFKIKQKDKHWSGT